MPALTRCLRPLALAFLVALAPAAAAEGLVQLSLHGELSEAGGAFVQVEVDVWHDTELRRHDLHAHLAQGTSAHELADLLATRLTEAGVQVRYSEADSAKDAAAQLFIEHTTALNLRLGFGLWGEVTTCEEAPKWIRLVEPQLAKGAARIDLTATTYHEHLKQPGRLKLSLPLTKDSNTASISQDFSRLAAENHWVGERPSPDRWTPLRSELGAAVIACNIRCESPEADWRLEVQLTVPGE
ncbi:MAG: hypothetical protein H6831_04130 [Planctomycetes bacterium]|nr:hypothetical protein [Planctomycetota bacterium]